MDYKELAKKLGVTEDALKNVERSILDNAETIVMRYSMKAFKEAKWDGQQWEKRKKVSSRHDRKNRDKPRALLVKAGHLRRSVEVRQQGMQIVVSSDMPYSQIHNEGGTINHPGGTPYIFDKETGKPKFISRKRADRMESRKRKVVVVPVTKPHKITIPKRQFMGSSKELEKDIEEMIYKKFKTIFT
jgi:phage gpG-like protein